ncbi:hypothetical protein [Methylocystis sp. Sn-Cys]|uniref:hypothetical protein n=1 Tax=Methylocystis sp. Sn-Cys TaxID=1701263 RepID=UPI0019235EF1|nr:hypothetical protein [Methylocystis sp. Sn-Cys]MBL1257091.1 hypothetical protein [Methylocystis sp. Sn-Cys]
MKIRTLIFSLASLPAMSGCNSTSSANPANSLDPAVYTKLGGVHAQHTPEQHAAFLKRVGQLPTDEDATNGPGLSGGGGHHH